MDQDTLNALRNEIAKVASGMMDALSIVGVIACASGNLSQQEFMAIAKKAAESLKRNGDTYGAQLTEGMLARLQMLDLATLGAPRRH